MSIRFERKPMFCTHLQKEVVELIEYSTPKSQVDDQELTWIKNKTECLQRKNCQSTCPGEKTVLVEK